MNEQCPAKKTLVLDRFTLDLVCDLTADHRGKHRSYINQDDVVFWKSKK